MVSWGEITLLIGVKYIITPFYNDGFWAHQTALDPKNFDPK